jgi:hypothetical protein
VEKGTEQIKSYFADIGLMSTALNQVNCGFNHGAFPGCVMLARWPVPDNHPEIPDPGIAASEWHAYSKFGVTPF